MPVVDVPTLVELIEEGRLDGRAVAVSGYWIPSFAASCPALERWESPLLTFCYFDRFSDVPYVGFECTQTGSAGECHSNVPPNGATLVTARKLGTNNADAIRLEDGDRGDPVPVVLIGHSGDPRYWLCRQDERDECREAFVVDRVAWVDGAEVNLVLSDADEWYEPDLTVEDIEAGIASPVISFAVTTERSASGIDPRLFGGGPSTTWVTRALDGQAAPDSTFAVEVAMVDDASGEIANRLPLESHDLRPAFFSPQAEERDHDPNGRQQPFFAVADAGGTVLHEGYITGSWSSNDGGVARSYPGAPTMLEPGSYTLRAWQGTVDDDERTWSDPVDECSTEISLDPGEHLRLEAAFPSSGPCSWREPTFEEDGGG